MTALIVRRLLTALPMLFVVTLLAFSMISLLPGDPATAIAGEDATAEQIAYIRSELGLNDPFVVRYINWLTGLLTGDLGDSVVTGRSVTEEIFRRAPATGSIALGTLVVAVVIGVPVGLLQGMFSGKAFDKVALVGTSTGLAIPNFWLATILIGLFAVQLGVLPAYGYTPLGSGVADWVRHLILPSLALGVFAAAELARQLRAGYQHVYQQAYVQTARSKGIPAFSVVGKHIMKNAAAPAITVLGVRLSHLLAGTVIIEEILAVPGIGKYAIESIRAHDFPAIQALILFSAVVVVLVNLLIDVVYGLLNPKVRLS